MNAIYGMLGLCARAGKLASGEGASEKLIRSGTCKVAFIDEGASDNAKKAIGNAARTYEVPLIILPAGELGRATGKPGRMAAAIADESFARSILKIQTTFGGVFT
jgi:ribosomal protein L7Ae-like RNA K-turn-binding protein